MNRIGILFFSLIVSFILFPNFVSAAEASQVPNIGLFVQTAQGIAVEGNKLTLKGVHGDVLFFSDRPQRMAGHVILEEFLKEWNKGKDSFSADPPNATLSYFDGKDLADVVVEIKNPSLQGNDLTYEVRVLDGKLPASGGRASLFIDWFYGPHGGVCRHNFYTGGTWCRRPGWAWRVY